ncbi:MAG: hypothetical protein B6I30_07390 [Desulfobacteraceae bacterium 4572_187]|nr:MAG: hypothetical protein B6I30_07390 [Desulfobacteraceae bacterium 4572_187]
MTNPGIEIGVIADTHGLLRPEAVRYLKGCHYILHAGDVGKEAVLEELKAIAPTFSVRGNNEYISWNSILPASHVANAFNNNQQQTEPHQ